MTCYLKKFGGFFLKRGTDVLVKCQFTTKIPNHPTNLNFNFFRIYFIPLNTMFPTRLQIHFRKNNKEHKD